MKHLAEGSKGYRGVGMEGRIATWYAKNTAKDMREFQRLADQYSKEISAGARVLEVAPGPGYFCVELAKRGQFDVVGLDISRTFVEICTRNAREAGVSARFIQGNASAMPFAENTFDFVLCRAAFKNFTQPVEAMNEMHRVLKPGGRAIIIDLRKDASLTDIDNYIGNSDLSWKNKMVYKFTFRYLLIPRAYTKQQFEEMVSKSCFGKAQIVESGIGFEIVLKK